MLELRTNDPSVLCVTTILDKFSAAKVLWYRCLGRLIQNFEVFMNVIRKIFLLVFCCSFLAGTQIGAGKVFSGLNASPSELISNVHPGQVVSSLFWAGIWAGIANFCTPGFLEPSSGRVVSLAVFVWGTCYYVIKAYRANQKIEVLKQS